MFRMTNLAPGAMLLALLLTACSDEASGPNSLGPQFGKGAGGGGGGGVSVNSTDPASTLRNTTLDVHVYGSGFDQGSSVSFALSGITSTKVVANSTSFVSSTELVANVSVAADADTLKYDVVVMTTTGKKGIGSELFKIEGDPSATWLLPLDDATLSLRSDGKYTTSDGYSAYADGVCGVHTNIFATDAASASGDATITTAQPSYRDRKCKEYPRKVTYIYPDGTAQTLDLQANLQQIESPTWFVPVGATVTRGLNLATSRCGILRFKAEDNTGQLIAGDSVLVTRLDQSTWDVQSQAYPNNRVNCRDTGETLNINVRFRIVSEWPLP